MLKNFMWLACIIFPRSWFFKKEHDNSVVSVEPSKERNLYIVTLRYTIHPSWFGAIFGLTTFHHDVQYIGRNRSKVYPWSTFPSFKLVKNDKYEDMLDAALNAYLYEKGLPN